MNLRIPSIKNYIFMSNSAVNILHEQCSMSLVVYAPINVCKLDVKAVFSPLIGGRQLSLARYSNYSRRLQCGIRLWSSWQWGVCGPHGSGADVGSENSLFSWDFARFCRLRISDYWYQRSAPHRCGSCGQGDRVSTHWRVLQKCRVYRRAKSCGTDPRRRAKSCGTDPRWFWPPFKSTSKPIVSPLITLGSFMWTGWERGGVPVFLLRLTGRFLAIDNLADPLLLWDTYKCEHLTQLRNP